MGTAAATRLDGPGRRSARATDPGPPHGLPRAPEPAAAMFPPHADGYANTMEVPGPAIPDQPVQPGTPGVPYPEPSPTPTEPSPGMPEVPEPSPPGRPAPGAPDVPEVDPGGPETPEAPPDRPEPVIPPGARLH